MIRLIDNIMMKYKDLSELPFFCPKTDLSPLYYFFFSSLDNRIAQKFGPHIVQYSPSM